MVFLPAGSLPFNEPLLRPSDARFRRGAASLVGTVCLFMAFEFPALADDWPQWMGPRRDGVWRESGILQSFPEEGPPVRWRAPVGAGYSGPAVAGDRVYLMDRVAPEVDKERIKPLDRIAAAGGERVLCLDAGDGRLLWEHRYERAYDIAYPSGPRTTPLVADGRVYSLGAEGDLTCLDAESGERIWMRRLKEEYEVPTQTWGVSAHPLLDGERLICVVGGQGHAVVALDRKSGRELWRALDAGEPGYSSPVLIESGGRRQVIVWDSEALSSLDPETGTVFWSEPFPTKMSHAIATPRYAEGHLFIASFFDGSMLLELDDDLPRATVRWRKKGPNERYPEGLHCLISTPWIESGHIYGVCGYGQLRCLKLGDAEQLWETLAATTPDNKPTRWATAFLVKHGDRFFIYNEKGDLIIARLSPAGYEETSRAHLLEPTSIAGGRAVHWSHPAFAHRSIHVRNDQEIVCFDLAAPKP